VPSGSLCPKLHATGNYATSSPGFAGNNAARATITTTGNNMQLYQTGVSLKANTSYTLSFAGYSSSGADIGLALRASEAHHSFYQLWPE
jgi:hypothetical protein